jgi:hypothetical protein
VLITNLDQQHLDKIEILTPEVYLREHPRHIMLSRLGEIGKDGHIIGYILYGITIMSKITSV